MRMHDGSTKDLNDLIRDLHSSTAALTLLNISTVTSTTHLPGTKHKCLTNGLRVLITDECMPWTEFLLPWKLEI